MWFVRRVISQFHKQSCPEAAARYRNPFLNQESQNGPIRYFNSSFLEKQKAEDILSGLKNGLMELSAKLSIPLHVSMDSPNMN